METATQPLAEGEVEFVLPLGMTLEELQAGQPPDESAVEPVVPVVVEPVVTPPQPAPRGGHVPLPALLEERRKRQEVTTLWRTAEAEKQRLDRELRATTTARTHAIEFTADERKALREKADASGSIGEAFDEALTLIESKTKVQARAKNYDDRRREMADGETQVRRDHPYFEHLARKAGLWDAVQPNAQNQYADPALATRVYMAPNPANELFDLAVSKLESEGRLEQVMQEFQATTTPPVAAAVEVPSPAPSPAPAPAPVAAAPAAPAPAVPRIVGGAAATSDHPRGIRGLPSAGGPPRGVIGVAELDRLMYTDPDRYMALTEANPHLLRLHLGGGA